MAWRISCIIIDTLSGPMFDFQTSYICCMAGCLLFILIRYAAWGLDVVTYLDGKKEPLWHNEKTWTYWSATDSPGEKKGCMIDLNLWFLYKEKCMNTYVYYRQNCRQVAILMFILLKRKKNVWEICYVLSHTMQQVSFTCHLIMKLLNYSATKDFCFAK